MGSMGGGSEKIIYKTVGDNKENGLSEELRNKDELLRA